MADAPSESVLEIIERRLIPNEEAKKARGEVFTPLPLVRELLFGVRKDKPSEVWGVNARGKVFDDPTERIGGIPMELWKNPESKWLDPANGIGNFPFVAFQMLDYQLKDTIKDTTARRKHIVEKMLFMIEIDRGNVNTSFQIFAQLAPGAKPNICCADTLKLKDADLEREFGVSRFDVVMGNPPFNMPREVKGQTGTLWDKFIVHCLNIVKDAGYLVFITPPNWRRPESKLYEIMTNKSQLIFLHILGERETRGNFGAGARIDTYLLKKTPQTETSFIIDELGDYHDIDLKQFPFLPNYAFDKIKRIIVSEAEGIRIIFSSSIYEHRKKHVKKDKTGEYKYPIVHSMTQAGLGFLYTNDNTKGHFGQPKVLLNVGRHQYPYNDFEGQYGMSQIVFGIPIKTKEEGDEIVDAINTAEFKEIIKATKWGAFQTDYRMFKYFKPDFYKEFLKKPEGASRRRTRRNKRGGLTRRQNGRD